MNGSYLHAQASLWENNGHSKAVLFMEGEALDRSNGGGVVVDALYRVVLARGLRLTTDLEHLDLRPVRGWCLRIDDACSVTLEWPHFWPLLDQAPLQLPASWMSMATEAGQVVVFVGYGLGMREHARDGDGHPVLNLEHAAETGALASGAVRLLIDPGQ